MDKLWLAQRPRGLRSLRSLRSLRILGLSIERKAADATNDVFITIGNDEAAAIKAW